LIYDRRFLQGYNLPIIFPKENTNEKISVYRIDFVDSFRLQSAANTTAYPDLHSISNRAGSDFHARAFRHSGDSCGAGYIHYGGNTNSL
jgi:hypothetical protein